MNERSVSSTSTNWLIQSISIKSDIENTSWKMLAYGIYARVVDVSEIKRVSAAKSNEWAQRNQTSERWYKNNECVNTVQSTFHVVLCLLCTYWDIPHFGGLNFYSKSFKNAKICRYTLTAKWQRKRSINFLVKRFVKNINDGKDMR